ncbi:MAG: retroviral-like aspartic protease family protein [Candidatus Poribacteria bacterium]|nr:retroviral-like aspartic protease family protein [Candidatus Poribacteria bacterium]
MKMPVARTAPVNAGQRDFGKIKSESASDAICYAWVWLKKGEKMGLTKVTTKLTSLEASQGSYEEIFLVDTGATDSLAPSDELEKIGVRQEGKMTYERADGTVKEYPFGLVRIEFMGEITAGRVVFGDPGTEPLLGVTALESVGIMVDPANKILRRLPAIPLK